MKRELPHFHVGSAYGGSQDWFATPMMRGGGCGATVACDCCVCFDRTLGTRLYPFDKDHVTREDYVAFSKIMEPYLHPRWSGINTPELFMDGFQGYLNRVGETRLGMTAFHGEEPLALAEHALTRQIDSGFPVAYLNLRHKDRSFADYEWHWFLLNGYETTEDTLLVKAVTYGSWRWLDFPRLWENGCLRKGGMVLWSFQNAAR